MAANPSFSGCFDKIIHTPCLRTGEDVVQALRGLEGEVSERQLGKQTVHIQVLRFFRNYSKKYLNSTAYCANKTFDPLCWGGRDNLKTRRVW